MKKMIRGLLLPLAAVVMLLMTASVLQADARQTGANRTRVNVSWDNPSFTDHKVSGYRITWGKSYDTPIGSANLSAGTRSYTITGLTSYSIYKVRVYYYFNGSETPYSWYSTPVFTLPDKTTGINVGFGANQKAFKLSWNKPLGDAFGVKYQFTLRDQNGKLMLKKSGISNYSFMSDFIVTKVSELNIRPYLTINGRNYFGPWASAKVVPQPIVNIAKTKSFVKDGKLTLTWSKVTGAKTYRIYVSTSKDSGYRRVKTASGSVTSVTLPTFMGKPYQYNTTYYVKVTTLSELGNSRNYYRKSITTVKY